MIDKTVSRVISESFIYSTHTMLGVRHVGHLRTKWGEYIGIFIHMHTHTHTHIHTHT